jgi:hypothetical protein
LYPVIGTVHFNSGRDFLIISRSKNPRSLIPLSGGVDTGEGGKEIRWISG